MKIWEYNRRWVELEKDQNPFALVVMAHLKTKATRGDARERLSWKVKLVRQDAPIRRLVEKANQEQILLWAKRILTASSQDEIFAT